LIGTELTAGPAAASLLLSLTNYTRYDIDTPVKPTTTCCHAWRHRATQSCIVTLRVTLCTKSRNNAVQSSASATNCTYITDYDTTSSLRPHQQLYFG